MTVIINPDKTISVNGKKTFVLGLYGICHDWADGNAKPETCAQSVRRCSEFLFDPTPGSVSSWDSPTDPWLSAHNKVMFCVKANAYNSFYHVVNNPFLFGYYQVDEPDGVSQGMTVTELSAIYNSCKLKDRTHPVVLNHWHKASVWYPYCDIFSWDNYFIQDTPLESAYTRATCIFLWEARSYSNIVSQIASGNLDNASKPVITGHQANVIPYTAGPHNYAVPTRAEARCLAYTSITMGVKGIDWWNYSIPWRTEDYGLMTNDQKLQEYIQLVKELKSINDVLVSPTVDKSYEYLKGTRVIFSPNPTMTLEARNRQVLNYMLKMLNNRYYLIVVNKSALLVSNISVTISGLAGKGTAVTLGLETSGSARAGRSLQVVNGKFSDSFDPYAAHVYEISRCVTLKGSITVTAI